MSKKRWTEKAKSDKASPHPEGVVTTENIAEKLGKLSVTGNISQSQFPIQVGSVSLGDEAPTKGHKGIWKPKAYSTARGSVATDVHGTATDGIPTEIYNRAHGAECRETASVEKIGSSLTKLFKGPLGEDFTVDNLTYASAQIRATFYPKFENEKSDQEVFFLVLFFLLNCMDGTQNYFLKLPCMLRKFNSFFYRLYCNQQICCLKTSRHRCNFATLTVAHAVLSAGYNSGQFVTVLVA